MYGTLEGADTYHQTRGNAAWGNGEAGARTAALIRATDYIDGRYRILLRSGRWASMFPGVRTAGRGQPNEWPRTRAIDNEGAPIPADEVPVEVVQASYEAALRELANPGSLSPDYVASEAVSKEKVGPIEVTYLEASAGDQPPNRPAIPVIDGILGPLLRTPAQTPAVRVV